MTKSGKNIFLLIVTGLLFFSCNSAFRMGQTEEAEEEPETRVTENFGEGWQFQRLEGSATDETEWVWVNIPHTTRVEPLVVNDQWEGTSVYRKNFLVQDLGSDKWFFHFEGVMQEARVSINGVHVLTHKGGYLPFTLDATPHLREGLTNTIEVVVINTHDPAVPPGKELVNLDFNLYGGIYRNVQLIKTNPLYITDAVHANEVNGGGVLVHFDTAREQYASGIIKTHIRNETKERKQVGVRIILEDPIGQRFEFESRESFVESGEDLSITEEIAVDNPFLWSPATPELYDLRVQVIADGTVVDAKKIRTGIRDIKLEGDTFYLNGEEMLINGTNRHQEYPYVGYALSDEAQYRDAYKIKQAGFDMVRLSHYPHATAFLEACDELGLLVMNPIPGWQNYEEGEFAENAIQNLKDMVRRDRNHPSVVFWENSLDESQMSEQFILRANEVLEAELPYEDIYSAGWMDHPAYDVFIPGRQQAEPPHYWNNYNTPDRPVFIAEYGDWEYYAQNAGFTQDEFSDLEEEERSSRQLRSSGEAGLLQQALNFQEAFNHNIKGEQTIGHANWLMFDYNRGYADNIEASGIADIFRIPKFSYYFYKSQKAPYVDEYSEPMVFVANFWTPDSATDVKVFTNTEEVALYLNDELIDRKGPTINKISDELPFPPVVFELDTVQVGELRAVGFINGQEVSSHKVRTPGAPAKIHLAIDRSGKSMARNTPDVVFVYAIIRDENGTPVPTAENRINFSLEESNGNAELIGSKSVKAEAGIASILLRTESFTDPIVIMASSEELGEFQITLTEP